MGEETDLRDSILQESVLREMNTPKVCNFDEQYIGRGLMKREEDSVQIYEGELEKLRRENEDLKAEKENLLKLTVNLRPESRNEVSFSNQEVSPR